MTPTEWLRTRLVIGAVAALLVLFISSTVAPAADSQNQGSSDSKILARGAPLHGTNGVRFDRQGRLRIASVLGQEIVIMDPRTGAVLDRLGPANTNVGTPDDLIFGPDGSLYWTSAITGEVSRLSPAGDRTTQVVGPGPNAITFSDNGRLFVAECFLGDALLELDPELKEPPRVIRSDLGPGCGLDGMDWFGGFLYGARWFTGEVVRVNVDSGELTTVASGFGAPAAVKFDSHGRLHVLDALSGEVVRVDTESGKKTVIAHLAPGLDNLAFDSQDRLFVSSFVDGFIIQVLSSGQTRTVSKGGMIAPGGVAVLPGPRGSETVFVADWFSLRAFAGRTGRPGGTVPSVIGVSPLKTPLTASSDGTDHLVLSSWFDNAVQVWDPETQQVLEQYLDFAVPMNAIRFRGDLIVAELGTRSVVRRSATTGDRVTLATGLFVPAGLAGTDSDLYVSDWAAGIIWKIVAGGAPLATPVAIATGLHGPEGLAFDRDGSLLVVESAAGRLSRIEPATGNVSTVVDGLAIGAPGPSGFPPTFVFNGVAVGHSGTIYVTGDVADVLYRFRPGTEY